MSPLNIVESMEFSEQLTARSFQNKMMFNVDLSKYNSKDVALE